MWIALRILFGVIFIHFARLAWLNAEQNPNKGDLENAFYTAVCLVLGIANAIVWAPFIGRQLSAPLTSLMTDSTFVERENRLMRLVQWLSRKRWRRVVLLLCFLEGIRNPWSPVPFLRGFQNARPGTWLEKVFAREVYRFGNIQNCVKAYRVLKEHGCAPAAHPNAEVELAILAIERPLPGTNSPLKLPAAPARPPLRRNRRIALFDRDGVEEPEEAPVTPGQSVSPPAPAGEENPFAEPGRPEPGWLRWYGKLAVWWERR